MHKDIITLFGATGDLAVKKLLPSLASLITEKKVLGNITIIALGRRDFSQDDYFTFLAEKNVSEEVIKTLRLHVIYFKLDVHNKEDYLTLGSLLTNLSARHQKVVKLFYLAVSPDLFIPIAEGIHASKIVRKNDQNSLLAFEKPFGHHYEHAQVINAKLCEYFDESQIYRVDHYLGKEMIQNIRTLRFANPLFANVWNKKYIKEIKIVALENEGILTRGTYYDEVGVINDMVQSHLLQMLTLVTSEESKSETIKDLNKKKINVLKQVQIDEEHTFFGQYKGYLEEKGVKENSKTPTLAFISLTLDNPRFKDIPIYLISGKKMAVKESYIEVIFKKGRRKEEQEEIFNSLRISLAPESHITLNLVNKSHVEGKKIENIVLDYCYSCFFPSSRREAYEKLFLEMLNFQKTLFPTWQEIALAWDVSKKLKKINKPLLRYDEGLSL